MAHKIVSFDAASTEQKEEAARVLMVALAHAPSAWHDLKSAMAVVDRCIELPDRLAFGIIHNDVLVGWIGAICHSKHQWELHPLVVSPEYQAGGYGRLLVDALEQEAKGAGVCSLWLGTDDEFGGTNLFDTDLYPDVLGKLANLAPAKGHPYEFYQKLGFVVTGVLPDADGFGRHDIQMAKRIYIDN